jgi:hypothetical protein
MPWVPRAGKSSGLKGRRSHFDGQVPNAHVRKTASLRGKWQLSSYNHHGSRSLTVAPLPPGICTANRAATVRERLSPCQGRRCARHGPAMASAINSG